MGVEITSVSKDKSGNYYDNDIEAIRESDDQGRLLASGLRWKEGRDGFLGVLSFLLLVISIAAGAVGCLALAYIAFLSNVSWNTTYALAGCVVVFVIGPAEEQNRFWVWKRRAAIALGVFVVMYAALAGQVAPKVLVVIVASAAAAFLVYRLANKCRDVSLVLLFKPNGTATLTRNQAPIARLGAFAADTSKIAWVHARDDSIPGIRAGAHPIVKASVLVHRDSSKPEQVAHLSHPNFAAAFANALVVALNEVRLLNNVAPAPPPQVSEKHPMSLISFHDPI
jgi:hypothetical protein